METMDIKDTKGNTHKMTFDDLNGCRALMGEKEVVIWAEEGKAGWRDFMPHVTVFEIRKKTNGGEYRVDTYLPLNQLVLKA